MAVFGAEQIQESKIKSRYFDKYVVAVNIGGIVATSTIIFIQTWTDTPYFIASLVAVSMLAVSMLLFIIGVQYCIHIKPYNTIITKCTPVFINAFRTWRRYKKHKHSVDEERRRSSTSNRLSSSDNRTNEENSIGIDHQPTSFLDFAKTINHGRFQEGIVDDVKSLRGALVVFTLLIPYWLAYNQVK
jgi:hypothetical protein